MKRRLFRAFLNRLTGGAVVIVYPNGVRERYGKGRLVATLTLHDEGVIRDILREPSLGFGEAYMTGRLDVEGDLHDLVALVYRNQVVFTNLAGSRPAFRLLRGFNRGATIQESQADIAHHYDLGNDFYRLWLDPTLSYSCAYFRRPTNSLATAQKAKIAYTLRKLQLSKGMRLLDIGSGWGSLILTAAKTYGVHATGITLSKEQLSETQRQIAAEKLTQLVDVFLLDYRELTGTAVFDRIVSVGMFEHVGRPNYDRYLATLARLLKPQGLALLHTITSAKEGGINPWLQKYIFPGTYIPAWREVIEKLPDHGFYLTDVESLRLHYALTLDQWAQNFERHVDQIRQMFDDRFVRMWRLYLRSCAASFRTSGLDIHQFVFTKGLNNELALTRDFLYASNRTGRHSFL